MSQVRILILSIGTARPSASAVIAKGLGLPLSTVVSRIYNAPTVLIDEVDESIATQMISMLVSIGFVAEVQSINAPPPVAAELYDVAIYLEDARKLHHAVKKLSEFVGINEADASHMILSPPGIVLGSVSQVTVQALSDQMGSEISVLSSPANTALHSLYIKKEATAAVYNRIVEDIKHAGYSINDQADPITTNIDHLTAKNLWQRYQATGMLQIINQDFIRFDLVLQKNQAYSSLNPEQIKVLKSLANIPAEIAVDVVNSAPITLMESIPNTKIDKHIQAFSEVGLDVTASMITFQLLSLAVLHVTDNKNFAHVLQSFDLHQEGQALPATPFQIPAAIPELQARVIRAALEDTGAEVDLVELSI